MEKKRARKMALSLALMELLSLGSIAEAKMEGNSYNYEDGKLTISDFILGEPLSSESGKYYLFNDETISIDKFGMWKKLQGEYPLEEFASFEHAMDFYRTYFDIIKEARGKYLSTINRIFAAFEGNEDEFERIFGQSMYKDGHLNHEIFSSDPFDSSNIKSTMKILSKTFAEIELERYAHSKEYLDLESYDSPSKYAEKWFESYRAKIEKYSKLYDAFCILQDDYVILAIKSAQSAIKSPANVLKKP